ncbi:MBG domain-containing protein [Flavobacterium acetivorans]|uniref:MBG domain-containing protein n=1 Tax=Flavobacterium acetivorans TaxID=2893883 RepID=UPI001E2B5DB8|nr:MBG domain-containing protein [Flavobacterium sp. F-29]UFH35209.1 T9SS type A sorting domain-containing protein [Flavobacterium sp. F-29]
MKTFLPKPAFLTIVFFIANLFFAGAAFGQATVTTDKEDYAPGEYVIISGSGWLPGETVTLHFDETPKPATCLLPHDMTAVADSNGTIFNNQFLIKINHIGVSFLLTATGATSGLQAFASFTDGNIRIKTNSGTISVSAYNHDGPGCSGSSGSETVTLVGTSNPGESVAVADNNKSSFIKAPAVNSLNQIFSSWTTNDSYTTPDSNKPYEICVVGKNGTIDFTANYIACTAPPAPTIISPITYCQGSLVNALTATGSNLLWYTTATGGTGSSTAPTPSTVSSGTTSYYVSQTVGCESLRARIDVVINGITAGVIGKGATQPGPGCGTLDPGITSTVNAIGSSAPSYIWQQSTDGGITWSTIAETSSQYNPPLLNISTSFKRIATSSLNGVSCSAESNILTFEVNPLPIVASILPGGTTNVCVDSALQLSNATPGGVWSSSNTGIATVNATGLVTGVLAGNVTISYTVTDEASGCFKAANKTVNVYALPTAPTAVNFTGPYDGIVHTSSATVAAGETIDWYTTATGTTTTTAPTGTNAGTYSAYAEARNTTTGCKSATRTLVTVTISKADALVSVSGYSGVYDALAHGAIGSATGIGSIDLSSGLNLGLSFTDVPGGTANWTFDGGINYNNESGSVAIDISKADALVSVSGYSGVYDALAHGAMGTATGIGSVDLSSGLNLGLSFTDVPGGTANWTFDGGINYNNESGSVAIDISKADALVSVNGYSGVYDALAHGATGSATGIGSVDLSSGLNLGLSFTDVPGGTANWTFDGGINYNNESGSVAIDISKADALVSVNGYSGVYDALAHGATGSATGIGSVDLSSGLNLGLSFTDVPGGTANWTFDGGINYNNESGSVAIDISKADALVSVNGYSGVYDALAHGATGSATGIGSVDLSSGLNLGLSFTDVPGGTANWTFDGGINYNNESGSVAIDISKADALVSVSGYSGVYDALAHGATGSATGIGSVDLSSGLNLGLSFTDVPGGTANWTFDGGINYNNESGSVAIDISKADALVSVNGYSGVYDALAHGATGSATGIGSVDLSSGLNLGLSFTDVPGGTANWTFDGGINYNNESGSVAIDISKADALVSVNGYSGVYDALAHGATGSATGIGSVDLSSGLNLGLSFTDVPGGTANWTFDGGINYNNESGSVAIDISKADALVSVSGYSGVYDGLAHGAMGTATGIGSVDLSSGLNLGLSFTDVPGGTANWIFDGGINYNNESGSVAIDISKADALVSVNGYSGVYDALAHGATGSATGIGSIDLSSGLNLGLSFTDVPGGIANWTFDGGINYNNESGSVAIDISKADALVSVSGYSGVYDGLAHGAMGSATGIGSVDLSSGLNLGLSFTDVPGGTANWTFDGGINYNDESGSVAIDISKADALVSVSGYSGVYDGLAHGATGSATGVGLIDLSSGLNLGLSFTDVPGGTANWTFDGGINYNNESGSVAIDISKADALVSVSGYSGVYDGLVHGATGSVTGVGLIDLSSGLNLGLSFTDVPGGTANWTFDGGINYNNESGSVAIDISKALLTVTADNKMKYCGQTNPTFTIQITGFMNGETAAVLDVHPLATILGDNQTIAVSGGADNNYGFNYVNGLLTTIGINIDASASSAPVPVNSLAKLKATVTASPVIPGLSLAGIPVLFTLDNGNGGLTTYDATTDATGLAITSGISLPVEMYQVNATVSPCASSMAYLPVYDPDGGFVTGGGWINSPVGAYVANPSLIGKANFGFVAKYKKGSALVDGNTEFQFNAANLNFKSSSHEAMTLVISGAKATYKGVGTVNGSGNFGFMVSAIDGQITGGGGTDKFRIKIWDKNNGNALVYDNQNGAADNTDATTVLGGGSIVIHEVKKKNAKMEVLEAKPEIVAFSITAYPNPSSQYFNLELAGISNEKVEVSVFDVLGRMVKHIENSNNKLIKFGDDFPSGAYLVLVRQGTDQKTIRLIKQ